MILGYAKVFRYDKKETISKKPLINWTSSKLKIFTFQKALLKMQRRFIVLEKIFSKHLFDEFLMSIIYKNAKNK